MLPECSLMSGPSRAHRQHWFLALGGRVTRGLRRDHGIAPPIAAALLVAAFGCGTKTSGIEECRQIELARCRSAGECGVIEDVSACERYVEDHCLHGFDPALGPSKTDVQACAEAIEDVGACAERSGTKTDPQSCRQSSLRNANVTRVCDLVERPDRIPSCRFLAPTSTRTEELDAGRQTSDPDDEGPSAILDSGMGDAGE